MKTKGEILLAALLLAGLYCAIPKYNPPAGDHVLANSTDDQVVLIAEGTAPWPGGRIIKHPGK
jgi:hypothetical protein